VCSLCVCVYVFVQFVCVCVCVCALYWFVCVTVLNIGYSTASTYGTQAGVCYERKSDHVSLAAVCTLQLKLVTSSVAEAVHGARCGAIALERPQGGCGKPVHSRCGAKAGTGEVDHLEEVLRPHVQDE
jgi:hypothetical protein